MLAAAKRALSANGHQVLVADLYRERFNPVPNPAEFTHREDENHFELMREQAHASATGTVSAEVAREQDRVRWADALLFQFPFWWWSMPAILKGWVDRVLSNGFAYGSANLDGKAAMLCMTAETRASRFAADADYPILKSIEIGTMQYCGLTVLNRFVAADILAIDDDARRAVLAKFEEHVQRELATFETISPASARR